MTAYHRARRFLTAMLLISAVVLGAHVCVEWFEPNPGW